MVPATSTIEIELPVVIDLLSKRQVFYVSHHSREAWRYAYIDTDMHPHFSQQ